MNDEGPPSHMTRRAFAHRSGGVLLSRRVSPEVPSALEDLTSLFGMGRGVTPPLWPPKALAPPKGYAILVPAADADLKTAERH
jgi:hypothetical protein